MKPVSVEQKGDIAVVTINNPPVNAASHAVRAGLLDAVGTIEALGVRAAVLICAGRTFVAGADVREFGQPTRQPELPVVVDAIENSTVPWVAAMQGTALGGGLELALGCAYRLAESAAKLGLPEVLLGLIPGAGGTVRLPRLVGPKAALEMIASGKPVSAAKALEIGLVDQLAASELGASACAFAANLSHSGQIQSRMSQPVASVENQADWQAQKDQIRGRARGQNSPLAAIEALENTLKLPPVAAMKAERDLFLKLKDDPQSLALRRLFFAERSVSKMTRLQGVAPRDIASVGVIGGGTMGAGIAATCLLAGLPVTMIERDAVSLDAGQARVLAVLRNSFERGLIDASNHSATKASFSCDIDFAALGTADLVIEAVFEDMVVKHDVFAKLDEVTRPDAILATNTSYLDINEIARQTRDPSRVLGLHFFSPAHIMKLLEIVHTETVRDDVLASGFVFAKRLGKIAVPAGVCDGFIANRMMSAYRREADYMLEDGALPQDIDAAMVEFGFPMGVFAMQDLAGLDIGWAMRKRQAATRAPDVRYVDIADRLCEAGRLGRKTGKGWYDYSNDPKGLPDPVVEVMINDASTRGGIKRRPIASDQVMERILTVLRTEGQKILDEGIAESGDAINVVMANGYGFPRWRGGPM